MRNDRLTWPGPGLGPPPCDGGGGGGGFTTQGGRSKISLTVTAWEVGRGENSSRQQEDNLNKMSTSKNKSLTKMTTCKK